MKGPGPTPQRGRRRRRGTSTTAAQREQQQRRPPRATEKTAKQQSPPSRSQPDRKRSGQAQTLKTMALGAQPMTGHQVQRYQRRQQQQPSSNPSVSETASNVSGAETSE